MTGRSRQEQWRGAIKVNSEVSDVNNKQEVCIINVSGALLVGDLPFLACPEELCQLFVMLHCSIFADFSRHRLAECCRFCFISFEQAQSVVLRWLTIIRRKI